jgi:glycosyltransferase involved in cell wall biosynthesis
MTRSIGRILNKREYDCKSSNVTDTSSKLYLQPELDSGWYIEHVETGPRRRTGLGVMVSMDSKPRVAILMATKDGALFLREQLESFAGQTFGNWHLYVSDDGSSDDTMAVLQEFKQSTSASVDIRRGPNKGPSENFLSLACDPLIDADFFAFSDQDDVWFDDKLERAIARLIALGDGSPAFYCSRTLLVDRNNQKVLGTSPLFKRKPSFANALVQSLGGGNTMVFNRSTKRLLEQNRSAAVIHDWWTYQLVTGAGGVAIYDEKPSLRYRQHGANVIGSNMGWRAQVRRLKMLVEGRFGRWNEVNISALFSAAKQLTDESKKQLSLFDGARRGRLDRRILNLWRSGVYRQTLRGNAALYLAVILAKL